MSYREVMNEIDTLRKKRQQYIADYEGVDETCVEYNQGFIDGIDEVIDILFGVYGNEKIKVV